LFEELPVCFALGTSVFFFQGIPNAAFFFFFFFFFFSAIATKEKKKG